MIPHFLFKRHIIDNNEVFCIKIFFDDTMNDTTNDTIKIVKTRLLA